jgi:hypothetical protein
VHPDVCRFVDVQNGAHEWCAHIESSATDAVVGKVLCTCAALAIAKEVITTQASGAEIRHKAAEPLELLDQWIDSPTQERTERICDLLYDDKQAWSDDLDPYGVVWWSLRVAMSSVGNFEAGWALETLCSAANEAGFDDETVREIARSALFARVESA